ncbi:MAG: hypothetical protein PHD40_00145 [Syntrophomonadaceae bacterium]|nr:hypothetical protein [Syntrophomonadaceae bacterium]
MRHKLLIMIFTASFILFTSWPFSACNAALNNDDSEQVFMAMQHSFKILHSFLFDVEVIGGNNVSLHGASIEEAYRYLCDGFTPSMAKAILICYSQWQPQYNRLIIIPTEGLPLITTGNNEDIFVKGFNHNEAVFSKYYYNCYAQDDCWQYEICLVSDCQGWKIDALSLNEIKKSADSLCNR